jgi:signal transduction histidine kinase
MLHRDVSLVTRVARTAAVAASASALVAAVATSTVGAFLLQQAEDRRLFEAGRDLVFLLGQGDVRRDRIEAIVVHEHAETQHAGIRFAVSDADGVFIAGERPGGHIAPDECSTRAEDRLRSCSVAAAGGVIVTAVSIHTPHTLPFVSAALVALAFCGLMTWVLTRPVVSSVMAPFSRLRARVAAIDVDVDLESDLGAPEHVVEVDELRATIEHLLGRVGTALEQAQRFAANAAHELRTPLTAVRAELQLLAEHASLSSDVSGDLATAQSKVGDLVVLVDRLLVLATPKRAAIEPNEIVSLRDVLEDVVRTLPAAQRSKVQLSEVDALVRGDRMLLESLFANALTNGLKFGDQVRVAMTLAEGVATITLDDDGPGLAEADWERVFEPFYRDPGALRRRQPGHGLGLALVRHIAESHGGSAGFQRREGPGARLQVQLPEMES